MSDPGSIAGELSRSTTLLIQGEFTLRRAPQLGAQIQQLLSGARAVLVDCTDTSDVDLSAIQLLLSARCSAQAAGKSVTLKNPASGALREALSRGGFLSAATSAADRSFWLKD